MHKITFYIFLSIMVFVTGTGKQDSSLGKMSNKEKAESKFDQICEALMPCKAVQFWVGQDSPMTKYQIGEPIRSIKGIAIANSSQIMNVIPNVLDMINHHYSSDYQRGNLKGSCASYSKIRKQRH